MKYGKYMTRGWALACLLGAGCTAFEVGPVTPMNDEESTVGFDNREPAAQPLLRVEIERLPPPKAEPKSVPSKPDP